jgi:hypothetical protein
LESANLLYRAYGAVADALPAMGRDLDGRYANSPLKPWFDQLKSRNGASAVRLPTATSKTTGEQ